MTPRPRLLFVHGWNSKRGEALRPLVKEMRALGYEVKMLSSGRLFCYFRTKWMSRTMAKVWSGRVKPTDVLIGRSNGARIVWEMSFLTGTKVSTLILLNPALERWATPGSGITDCHVFHNPTDWAAWAARFVPWSDWGDMGRVGYKSLRDGWPPDPRMHNHKMPSGGHGPYATDPQVARLYAVAISRAILRQPAPSIDLPPSA